MLKIDLPTDRQETNAITSGETIHLDYQILLRGPINTTQTNWNNTGETNIFIEEDQESENDKGSDEESKKGGNENEKQDKEPTEKATSNDQRHENQEKHETHPK